MPQVLVLGLPAGLAAAGRLSSGLVEAALELMPGLAGAACFETTGKPVSGIPGASVLELEVYSRLVEAAGLAPWLVWAPTGEPVSWTTVAVAPKLLSRPAEAVA